MPVSEKPPVPAKEFASSIVFGDSQSAVLELADGITRRPCSEPCFPDLFSSKVVNFYPITLYMALSAGG
jgi:hypothetical protein